MSAAPDTARTAAAEGVAARRIDAEQSARLFRALDAFVAAACRLADHQAGLDGTPLELLLYLALHPDDELTAPAVAEWFGLPRQGASNALRRLVDLGHARPLGAGRYGVSEELRRLVRTLREPIPAAQCRQPETGR